MSKAGWQDCRVIFRGNPLTRTRVPLAWRRTTEYMFGMVTPRQRQILELLKRAEVTPTVEELRAKLGLRSVATVAQHLDALERKGLIRRERGLTRNIRLVGKQEKRRAFSLPLLGSVPAGFPEAEASTADSFVLDAESLGLGAQQNLFALRVRGDSMVEAGIFDGDLAILEAAEPKHRDIVAALIDGETTLKRYLLQRGRPFLRAENPRYPDLIPARELVIQGVYRALIRTAR